MNYNNKHHLLLNLEIFRGGSFVEELTSESGKTV